jgi:hypothetical protein
MASSPGVRAFLATVARNHLANFTSASGDQDHTLSPSASALLVQQPKSVHRIPRSTFRDDWP